MAEEEVVMEEEEEEEVEEEGEKAEVKGIVRLEGGTSSFASPV